MGNEEKGDKKRGGSHERLFIYTFYLSAIYVSTIYPFTHLPSRHSHFL